MQLMERQNSLDESQGTLRRMLSQTVAEAGELEALKCALRECRQRLHRGALDSTRRIVALNSSVASLEALTQAQQSHIRNLEADLALVRAPRHPAGGQDGRMASDSAALADVAWRDAQRQQQAVHEEAHRVWTLKKNLADAHAEYGQLAEERDHLALLCSELRAQLSAQLSAPSRDCSPPRPFDQ